ncbi:hypothetical protein SSX86_013114 [Deinandra increscens subsp. villosa]|uniref:FAF domain-containing protein n=1 Tax=Deinandra increscens subsp. villosa TaxID=3103831 RepID=A0AAP0H249_9ASTR
MEGCCLYLHHFSLCAPINTPSPHSLHFPCITTNTPIQFSSFHLMASVNWSFLKVLENPSTDSKNLISDSKNLDKNDAVYVHPTVRHSLSTKSLEMCTESLGSETGSEVSESGDELCAISIEERERLREIQKSKCRNFDRKIRRFDFPPPLTSISGSDGGVKVRHHREDGRLVIKAVSFSNCGTNFQAERTDGRLKLSFLKGCFVNCESEGVGMEECDEVESDGDEVELDCDEVESDGDDVESEGDEVESEAEEEGGGCRWEDDGDRWMMAGNGELRRLTRCKEGGSGNNKVFANWGSSWVAIS